jgi:hypothetical protein
MPEPRREPDPNLRLLGDVLSFGWVLPACLAAGGGLGWLSRTDLPGEFEKAIWGLPAGGVSPPQPAGHGVHLFRVEERADGRVVPFEEARPALRLALSEKRSSEALERLLEEVRKRHRVAVIEEHLPFPYVGGAARFSLDSAP